MISAALQPLSASEYRRHALHRGDRAWPETNCFADLWIEVLHTFGHEPLAALGCTLDLDFEGDQFTFFAAARADGDDFTLLWFLFSGVRDDDATLDGFLFFQAPH